MIYSFKVRTYHIKAKVPNFLLKFHAYFSVSTVIGRL